MEKDFTQKVNRYLIHLEQEKVTFILQKNKSKFPILGIAAFYGISAFLVYLAYSGFAEEYKNPLENPPIYGAVFMFIIGSVGIYRNYWTFNEKWILTQKAMIKTSLWGKSILAERDQVIKVFIKKTEIIDRAKNSYEDYRFSIMFEIKDYNSNKTREVMCLDSPDSLKNLYGTVNFQDELKTQQEAEEIKRIISDFWNLKFINDYTI